MLVTRLTAFFIVAIFTHGTAVAQLLDDGALVLGGGNTNSPPSQPPPLPPPPAPLLPATPATPPPSETLSPPVSSSPKPSTDGPNTPPPSMTALNPMPAPSPATAQGNAGPSQMTATPTTTTTLPVPHSASSSGLSGGVIAGIVVGALAGIVIAGALVWLILKRSRGKQGAQTPRKGDNDVEYGEEGLKTAKTAQPTQPDNLQQYGKAIELSQKDLQRAQSHELPSKASQMPFRLSLDESLSDIHLSNSTINTQLALSSKSARSNTTSSVVMLGDTSVILKKGPGGAVHISQYVSSGPRTENSNHSNVSIGQRILRSGSLSRSSMGLPDLPWSDWELKADDIRFAKDGNGENIKLGSGAYGTVYKATIDGVTECACKFFHDVHNQIQQANILREVAILKGCRDRHIVQFLGACIMDERIMLVTELMEAGDLWHALMQYRESGALSWYRRGKRIALEIARGLHFLHRHKIIHFDLKSANVLLTTDGAAKISDVGFANILSNTHLSENVTAFTFAWAAPEILLGQPSSFPADIYSYGVLLWEIVTGLQPQRGSLRACRVPEECPAEIEQLIESCISVDPSQRPSCKMIVDILTRAEGQSAV